MPPQDANPTPSFGGFGLRTGMERGNFQRILIDMDLLARLRELIPSGRGPEAGGCVAVGIQAWQRGLHCLRPGVID